MNATECSSFSPNKISIVSKSKAPSYEQAMMFACTARAISHSPTRVWEYPEYRWLCKPVIDNGNECDDSDSVCTDDLPLRRMGLVRGTAGPSSGPEDKRP